MFGLTKLGEILRAKLFEHLLNTSGLNYALLYTFVIEGSVKYSVQVFKLIAILIITLK